MFHKIVPYEIVADDIIQRLMAPLKSFSPDMVLAVSQAFRDGRTPERAGQALLAGLQAWMEKGLAEQNAETQSYEETVSELRNSVEKARIEIKSLKSQIEKLEKEMDVVKNQKSILDNTISLQNKTLSQQHEQLMRLLSSTQSD
jgi:peptidoglycan hydrolase CwlO-like protein